MIISTAENTNQKTTPSINILFSSKVGAKMKIHYN